MALPASPGLNCKRGAVNPVLPLSLFRTRTVSVAVATGFAFMVVYYGLPFVMSLGLQEPRGLSALGIGVVFLPMMLTGALLTPFTAKLAGRFGARALIVTGLLAAGARAGRGDRPGWRSDRRPYPARGCRGRSWRAGRAVLAGRSGCRVSQLRGAG